MKDYWQCPLFCTAMIGFFLRFPLMNEVTMTVVIILIIGVKILLRTALSKHSAEVFRRNIETTFGFKGDSDANLLTNQLFSRHCLFLANLCPFKYEIGY